MKRHLSILTPSQRQGGAVIIVVIALMTTLVVLGLFAFKQTSQEMANAEYFASPSPTRKVDPTPLFNSSLEQLIVGTRTGNQGSVLWGGMHSLLAHEIGRIDGSLKPVNDTNLATGRGITVQFKDAIDINGTSTPDGRPDVVYTPTSDPDFGGFSDVDDLQFIYSDGTPSSRLALNIRDVILNHSPRAQADRTQDAFNQPTDPLPAYRPDVGYTYPDINSLFLAYDEVSVDPANMSQGPRRVIIPSFFRPTLFPELRSIDDSKSFFDLYRDVQYRKKVFRPSIEHRYSNGDLRYLTTSIMANSGDRGRILNAFPFPRRDHEAQMGIFSNTSFNNRYTLLDVDLDNDGVKDSIWMDLDLPLMTFSDGSQYVPLASFKVLDADGLLNLNAHGNIRGLMASRGGPGKLNRDLNGGQPVSISNLGMSRSEVNPLWALNGDLSSLSSSDLQLALKNVKDRFLTTPASTLTLANMEWTMLLQGWNPSTGEQEVLGRYGDRARLLASSPPLPGDPLTDDDYDNGVTGYGQQGVPLDINGTPSTDLRGLAVPGFVHPLSPIGLGMPGFGSVPPALTYQSSSAGAIRTLKALLTNNPAAWPQYVDYQQLLASSLPTGLLLKDTNTDLNNLLLNEDDETVLDPDLPAYNITTPVDSPYRSQQQDGAFLQLSSPDVYHTGISSRLGTLATANFQSASNAEEIRRQFTSESWDRLEFNFSAPTFRTWEWGTTNQFPPQVSPVGTQVQPFRQEIRDLMRTDYTLVDEYGLNRSSPRQRLNLNKILSNDQLSAGGATTVKTAFESASPRYRDLVPHPVTLSGDQTILNLPVYHGDGGATVLDPRLNFLNLNTGDTYLQEWWARYDRQRMARDIYCLLWFIGNGNDSSTFTAPTAQQSQEMAQFAVNVVDAMDRDSIITRFEYDPNLSDGWDTNSSNLQVVYGIEHQSLTFSEVLLIRTEHNMTDSMATEFDESATDPHYHSFIELRNAAPWDVKIDDSCWRIRRLKVADKTPLFSVELKNTSDLVIPAGEQYLIGCQDGSDTYGMGGNPRPSEFRFDANGDNRFEAIVPNIYEAIPPDSSTPETSRTPLCDLDLMHIDHASFINKWAASTNKSLLNAENANGETDILLVLERRLRPDPNGGGSGAMTDPQNPWVEVDRIQGTVRSFNSTVLKLDDLKSQERRGPYDSGNDLTYSVLTPQDYVGAATGAEGRHTLPYTTRETSTGTGQPRNSRSPATFAIWQPHFDRDFSSVMELLSIPLYGYYPSNDTGTPIWQGAVHGGATRGVAEPGGTLKMSGHRTAAMRFLYPQAEGDSNFPLPSWFPTGLTGDAAHYQNRWYRLLEFVTVKSQDEITSDAQLIANNLPTRRTPGKINLNTIRHEAVFAGLVDDPYHLNLTAGGTPLTQDQKEAGRFWYAEHKMARDGIDPFLKAGGIPNITIPGGFNARPFRPLDYLDQPILDSSGNPVPGSAHASLQHTILRMRDTTAGHGLYEARASGDIGSDTVDYHSRNRLLSKIANNSTTRSHVFFVWVGLDFFQAHVNGNGNVQLGAQAPSDELPSLRMFCVVDMTRLNEAYSAPSAGGDGSFDFNEFILYRTLLK